MSVRRDGIRNEQNIWVDNHLYFFEDFSLETSLKSLAQDILRPCLSCLSKRQSCKVFKAMVDCSTFSKSTKHNKNSRPLKVDFFINRMHWNPGQGRNTSKQVRIYDQLNAQWHRWEFHPRTDYWQHHWGYGKERSMYSAVEGRGNEKGTVDLQKYWGRFHKRDVAPSCGKTSSIQIISICFIQPLILFKFAHFLSILSTIIKLPSLSNYQGGKEVCIDQGGTIIEYIILLMSKKHSKKDEQKMQDLSLLQQTEKKQAQRKKKQQRIKQLAQKSTPLVQYGLLDSYQFFLSQLAAAGIPQGNIFEFAAQTMIKFQKSKNKKQQTLREVERVNSQAERIVGQSNRSRSKPQPKRQIKPNLMPFKGSLSSQQMQLMGKK